jgi:hypothetical protein
VTADKIQGRQRATYKGPEIFGIALRSFAARKDHKSIEWRWMEFMMKGLFAVDQILAVTHAVVVVDGQCACDDSNQCMLDSNPQRQAER